MTELPDWERFEVVESGIINVPGVGRVRMRVGLYMGIPLQVLISPEGEILKSRKFETYRANIDLNYALNKLEPKNPRSCRYKSKDPQYSYTWKPPVRTLMADIVAATLHNRTSALVGMLTKSNSLLKRLI